MGYKSIEPVMVHIDTLCQECGLFKPNSELNGGYGCLSRSKEKDEPGKCYDFDCPLAYPASLDDMKKHDSRIHEEWEEYMRKFNNENNDPSDVGSDWVVQFRECV